MSDTRAESIAIVLVGAGGLGREVLNYVLDAIRPSPHMRVKGFLDDNLSALSPYRCEFPILGSILDYPIQPQDRFVMTIGDCVTRAELIRKLEARGARFITIIHPTAYVAANATVGDACIVGPFLRHWQQCQGRRSRHAHLVFLAGSRFCFPFFRCAFSLLHRQWRRYPRGGGVSWYARRDQSHDSHRRLVQSRIRLHGLLRRPSQLPGLGQSGKSQALAAPKPMTSERSSAER